MPLPRCWNWGVFQGGNVSPCDAACPVSLQMRRLETALGVRLLERVGRRVTPTAAGLELLGHVRRIEEEVAAAMHCMARHVGGDWGGCASARVPRLHIPAAAIASDAQAAAAVAGNHGAHGQHRGCTARPGGQCARRGAGHPARARAHVFGHAAPGRRFCGHCRAPRQTRWGSGDAPRFGPAPAGAVRGGRAHPKHLWTDGSSRRASAPRRS